MKRTLFSLGLLLAALLAGPGCDRTPGSGDAVQDSSSIPGDQDSVQGRAGILHDDYTGRQSTVIRRGNGGEPGSLDPALAEDIHAFNVLVDLYEGLIAEGADGTLIPGIAEAWTVSDDGRVYTFALRRDARWSNGDPVVAADFVRSFQHVASPQTASSLAFLLEPVRNFPDVIAGRKSPDTLGIVAVSDYELEINLAAPTNHWLAVLALPIAFPRHAQLDQATVSNGAYKLISREVNGAIRLQRNEHYWNNDSVRVDEVVYYPIVDPVAEFNMYRAGELDITHVIPSEQIDTAKNNFGTETRIAPSLALYYLAFDLTEAPFDNTLLRQALTMAINREQLVALIGRGERAAYGIVPPGVAGYTPARFDWSTGPMEQRLQRARELYAQAGYSAANPLRIRFTYDTGDIHEKVALAVTAMWRDALGVDTTLDKREWQYFLDTRDQRSAWDVMRFSWFGDYNAAKTFLEIFQSGSPQNLARYRSERYDELLATAGTTSDLNESTKLMQSAEAVLINDYAVAPLYFFVSKHMVKPYVAGFKDNVMDRHPSRYLEIANENGHN